MREQLPIIKMTTDFFVDQVQFGIAEIQRKVLELDKKSQELTSCEDITETASEIR